jgi:hypothetical protein
MTRPADADADADQMTRPAGTGATGVGARAPVIALDYDEIDDTAPSTPYPGKRFRVLRKWFAWARSWMRGLLGMPKQLL